MLIGGTGPARGRPVPDAAVGYGRPGVRRSIGGCMIRFPSGQGVSAVLPRLRRGAATVPAPGPRLRIGAWES
jgi:hypothetical protein